MGESALRSHSSGTKHQASMKLDGSNTGQATMKTYLEQRRSERQMKISLATQSSANVNAQRPAEDTAVSVPLPYAMNLNGRTLSGRSVSQFVSRNDVVKAELLWTLKTISSHCSYSSNENIEKIFRVMFSDSQIAAKFTYGSRKTSYICVFGLAEHFKEMLMKSVKGYFTIKNINKKSKSKQMDIHVPFWEGNKVITRYFG